jgi:hypothetical protein
LPESAAEKVLYSDKTESPEPRSTQRQLTNQKRLKPI